MTANFELMTPVVLLVFNRPALTTRVFEAVRKARPTRLLVVADGPRSNRPGEDTLCAEVRQICQRVDWPCTVSTNFAPTNMGCRNRVSSGLMWAFEQVEEAIILEDDCLPHESFFRFCQDLLARHRDDSNVAMISGNCFLPGGYNRTFASYFFTRYPHIWGWATWRRAMKHYDVTMAKWPEVNEQGWLEDFFQHDATLAAYWRSILNQVHNGQIDTWDYQLTLSFWLRGMISICPARNLISNIGFGPDATHTTIVGPRANMPTHEMRFPLTSPATVTVDALADEFAASFVYNVPGFKGSQRMQMLFNASPQSLGNCSEQQRLEFRNNLLALATVAVQGGDAATALELAQICARTGPKMRDLFHVQGLCSMMLGDAQSARNFFELELSNYPDNSQAKQMLGML